MCTNLLQVCATCLCSSHQHTKSRESQEAFSDLDGNEEFRDYNKFDDFDGYDDSDSDFPIEPPRVPRRSVLTAFVC